jgi:hypothetical protein
MTTVLCKLSHAFRRRFLAAAALLACGCLSYAAEPRSDGERYIRAVRTFADSVLEHGRDTYGQRHTPLFVDGLQVETLEPVRWKKDGQTWVLCNFASQQSLLRTLDGQEASLPPAVLDNAFLHCQYDGATVPKKPNFPTAPLLYARDWFAAPAAGSSGPAGAPGRNAA